MPRLKLVLAYVGTNYKGWQTQAWKDRPPPLTIQNELEKAMASIVGRQVHVQGAGRTDSGVHADGQVAHCDIPEHRKDIDWQRALHTRLPHDIRVLEAGLTADDFDACSGATHKAYTYRLWQDDRYTPPKLYPYVWACGPLNLETLDLAAKHLLGEHDFRSLQNAGTSLKSTVRTIYCLRRLPAQAASSPNLPNASNWLAEGKEICLWFEANGFLKQMVRNITGLLVACGQGRYNPNDIPTLLAACDRRLAPPTAPPQGLTLSKVWYD